MDDNVKKALNDFTDDSNKNNPKKEKNDDNIKKMKVNNGNGLIERVDKVYLTEDGRQLLREDY